MAEQPGLGAYLARGIRARRTWLGLDQAEVGDRMGVSSQTVSDMERGRRRITVDDIPALCEALESTLAELVRDAPADLRRAAGL